MIEIRINRRKIEKTTAKIVWTAMQIATTIATIFLLFCIAAMIEACKIENTPFIISLVCLAWIKFFSRFVSNANNEKY